VSLALYRKYRPGSFAEVVGQEHVTEPLQTALRTGRIHHAYLFSGPRGCGKTSSARILARSLNCADGPTPTPCEKCDSCVALAPNGPGSLDVIEIDAASHGLVDDARDLRERAFFAPVSSTYKIYIIDEAHMISQAAFNALLKVVEEPPPHVKFIFATTEPEKVLSTIKSRTFHYRFRLIPPAVLREFLADLCAREGITVDPLVLPLVVRAGAGSARDALSVLDQLAAGAEDSGISYPRALAILGYTDAALLDETVDAFAAADGASVFRAVDRVVEAGIDPRRFAQDLLERFRDLLVLDAVPDAGETGLLDLPADTIERMRSQAGRLGRAALTRAGDVMAQALVDMRGTTSPRLVLELACARVLLPGGDGDIGALLARLDRLERRLSVTGAPPAAAAPPAPPPAAPPVAPGSAPTADAEPEPTPPDAPAPEAVTAPEPAAAAAPEPAAAPAASGGLDLPALRRIWPDLLDAVNTRSKTANALLRNAEPSAVDAKAITLSFTTAQLAKMFADKAEFLREALRDVIGLDVAIIAVVGSTPAPAFGDVEPSPEREPDPDPTDPDPADADPVGAAMSAPPDTEDPLARLQRDLGAEVVDDPRT
jgi:DNA polymerase-3 subunit gamma/tau